MSLYVFFFITISPLDNEIQGAAPNLTTAIYSTDIYDLHLPIYGGIYH